MKKSWAFFLVAFFNTCVGHANSSSDWAYYGADLGGSRYSKLSQITKANVNQLQLAWEYHTGDVSMGKTSLDKTTFEATPILHDDSLFFCTAFNRVIALNAATGKAKWIYDPKLDLAHHYINHYLVCRGVAYWETQSKAKTCASRIFTTTQDNRLVALDAKTGKPCQQFGHRGEVYFGPNFDPKPILNKYPRLDSKSLKSDFSNTSPPLVVDDLIIIGSGIAGNNRIDVPKGEIIAYQAQTGKEVWRFDIIPKDYPGITGAANSWVSMSADEKRHLVFVATGSASPDYYGGLRKAPLPYSNAIIALNSLTGQPVWHFQTIDHDLWDYDLASQPLLVEINKAGTTIPAVIQTNKTGFIYSFNRATGKPLFPIVYQRVPQSDVKGEQSARLQPIPQLPKPVSQQKLLPKMAWGISWLDRKWCERKLTRLRNEGLFTPPSERGSLQFPASLGGPNWGSQAYDPKHNLLIVNSSNIAQVIKLIPRQKAEKLAYKGLLPMFGAPFAAERSSLLSPLGMPCNPPPWGTLTAVDMASGEQRWQVTLGTLRDLAPLPLPIKTGTPNLGGPMVTASGLIFIAAAMDNYLRAFDVISGQELWRTRLPAGGQATPMTYQLGSTHKQYVVIAAGGHGGMGTKLGDSLLAYTLPEDKA